MPTLLLIYSSLADFLRPFLSLFCTLLKREIFDDQREGQQGQPYPHGHEGLVDDARNDKGASLRWDFIFDLKVFDDSAGVIGAIDD